MRRKLNRSAQDAAGVEGATSLEQESEEVVEREKAVLILQDTLVSKQANLHDGLLPALYNTTVRRVCVAMGADLVYISRKSPHAEHATVVTSEGSWLPQNDDDSLVSIEPAAHGADATVGAVRHFWNLGSDSSDSGNFSRPALPWSFGDEVGERFHAGCIAPCGRFEQLDYSLVVLFKDPYRLCTASGKFFRGCMRSCSLVAD